MNQVQGLFVHSSGCVRDVEIFIVVNWMERLSLTFRLWFRLWPIVDYCVKDNLSKGVATLE